MLSPTLLLALGTSTPLSSTGDGQERSLVFVIAAVILGLIVVLLVMLQIAAIRGRRTTRRKAVLEQTDSGVDPWAEAGRRVQSMDAEDDQS
jgi:hypothetical protein